MLRAFANSCVDRLCNELLIVHHIQASRYMQSTIEFSRVIIKCVWSLSNVAFEKEP